MTTTKFNILETNWSKKSIMANLNDFDEAIDFVKENKCDGLQLRSPSVATEVVPDFKHFEQIADLLTFLSIDSSNKLKKVKNVDGIYELQNLQKLVLAKEAIPLDLFKLKKLKEIGLEYSPKLKGLGELAELEIFVLRKYPKTDLTEFSSLKNLKTFHIYQSKIESAKGIETLTNLEQLNFSLDAVLKDISEVLSLKKLKKLHIERCEELINFSFDTTNTSIKELFISTLSSLKQIENLKGLETINFSDLKDGDMTPLLKLPSFKEA
ncbi:MAG TPA: hypothetical protein VLB84_04110, partial [Bacteroidia bacterium]|nr:hypothetical protein [Bacteroidia bacterium]